MSVIYLSTSVSKRNREPEPHEWWIVEPRGRPDALAVQIRSLLIVGRPVVAVDLSDGPEAGIHGVTLDTVPWPEVER